MSVIETWTLIDAPVGRCFDLARSIDLHMHSTAATGERAIAGVTAGLIGPGQEVTWRAKHFGVWQELTSRITGFDAPQYFQDSMVRGAFRSFVHDHWFVSEGRSTRMTDRIVFEAPGGVLGRLAERVVLTRYLRRFLEQRNAQIRGAAESEDWRPYLAS